jgi:hypothetical protein
MLNLEDEPRTDTVGEPRETIQINTSVEEDPQFQKLTQRQLKIRELTLRNRKNYEKMLNGRLKKYFFGQRLSVLRWLDDDLTLFNFDIQTGKLVKLLMSVFHETAKTAGQMVLDIIGKEDEYKVDKNVVFKYVDKTKTVNLRVFENVRQQAEEGIEQGESLDDIKKRIKKLYNYIDKRLNIVAKTEISDLMKEVIDKEFQNNGVVIGV